MLIQITNTCHMGCPHCMDRATPDPQHMPWPLVERSVAWAQSLGVRTMLISGGEPTCHPEWKRILDYCAERFMFVIVPTNGSWLETPIEDDIIDLLTFREAYRYCKAAGLEFVPYPESAVGSPTGRFLWFRAR